MSDETTPSGVRVIAVSPDGSERNITEGVQGLYDHLISSLWDWGSGFLTVEDVSPIVDLAKFCGFKNFEAAEKYMQAEMRKEKQRTCQHVWRQVPYGREYGQEFVRHVCDVCGKATALRTT